MQYDVIIVGGGMSGATLALALSRKTGKQVALIEAHPPSTAHPGFDARSIALSFGSIELLRSYGLWNALSQQATPIHRIDVSDRGHFGQTGFDKDKLRRSCLGAVVELAKVGRVYQELLWQDPNITLYCPEHITGLMQSAETVQVQLSSGAELQGQLLVAADGTHSKVAELLNIPNQVEDFAQSAVIANVQLDRPHANHAYERFTDSGPIALLPMSDQRMSLVWCTTARQAEQIQSWSSSQLLSELQMAFGWRAGKFVRIGETCSYPLALHKRERLIHHRVAIVGNAAQTLHPIAGQGFNLGIRDIQGLVAALQKHTDAGSYPCLRDYRHSRHLDREQTCEMTSGLVRLFSNNWFPLSASRNLGLALFDALPPLQEPLRNRSLGLIK